MKLCSLATNEIPGFELKFAPHSVSAILVASTTWQSFF